tara:strand:+ start:380 stop:649 length:270 start_codon:yes stop_codon:yes gene_type:complete
MDINLHQSTNGLFVLSCQGMFRKPLNEVHFDPAAHFLELLFEGEENPEQLNCPISDELSQKLVEQNFIIIGFFEDKELKATQFAPFVIK